MFAPICWHIQFKNEFATFHNEPNFIEFGVWIKSYDTVHNLSREKKKRKYPEKNNLV